MSGTLKIFSKIISGGQTGVDRAALDTVLASGIPTGGWCPRGRRAEDGPLEPRYPLQETHSRNYADRTERNILDSDGTLILTRRKIKGGTALTRRMARFHQKPLLIVDSSDEMDFHPVLKWGRTFQVKTLNVAGPRESEEPGIYQEAVDFLRNILAAL